MAFPEKEDTPALLLMVAGAKGAVASTVAVATAVLKAEPHQGLGGLTTAEKFPFLGGLDRIKIGGWDISTEVLPDAVKRHGVLPSSLWEPHAVDLTGLTIRPAPSAGDALEHQVEVIRADIRAFQAEHPDAEPVMVNLLPASCDLGKSRQFETLDQLLTTRATTPPDLAYGIAAVLAGIPVVNYTPNTIELEAVCEEAKKRRVPLAGRDGKSGQTYFKVVLASAFKARSMSVDGWYSLNILGNADGKNLMDPDRACGKLKNKTQLLNDILGYTVGGPHGESTHKVHIDYYPPRGDAKEAWDVIDFSGLFGLPMSLRLNLQGRDSILAAPMVIDLARWVAALKMAGMGGTIPELGFFFKKPVGPNPPLTFQDQLTALHLLERQIIEKRSVSPSSPA